MSAATTTTRETPDPARDRLRQIARRTLLLSDAWEDDHAGREASAARYLADYGVAYTDDVPAPRIEPPGARGHVELDCGVEGAMDSFLARMETARRDAAEHSASCTAALCSRCGRFACLRCCRVRVPTYDAWCWDCLLHEHIPPIGVPPRYQDAGFGPDAIDRLKSRVRSPAAVKIALDLVLADSLKSALIAGPAGTGKSSILGALAKQCVASALRENPPRILAVRWISAIDIGLARSRHRLGTEDDPELIVEAIDCDVLALDDLGAECARDLDAISQVIHARHDADRPTWTTTGLSSAELAARYGGGLARRLLEGATVIRCDATTEAKCGAP